MRVNRWSWSHLFQFCNAFPRTWDRVGLLPAKTSLPDRVDNISTLWKWKQFWCKNLPNLVYQKLKMQFAFFFLHISRKLCGRLRLQFNRSINMVGFSTGPQKETQLRRPGCIHGVKQMEIKWESCLIINHENRVLKLHRRETWTIAARNRRRSYSITGVFWGAAFTFRRRRRPLLPLRLPQLYPTSIGSGCLAIAEGYNHSIKLQTKSVSTKFTCMMSVLSL